MKIKVKDRGQIKAPIEAPHPPPVAELPIPPPVAMVFTAAPSAPPEDNLRLSAAQYCQLHGVNRTLAAGFCSYAKTQNAPMRQNQQAWGDLLERFKNHPVA
jgi:hypothetical protein